MFRRVTPHGFVRFLRVLPTMTKAACSPPRVLGARPCRSPPQADWRGRPHMQNGRPQAPARSQRREDQNRSADLARQLQAGADEPADHVLQVIRVCDVVGDLVHHEHIERPKDAPQPEEGLG